MRRTLTWLAALALVAGAGTVNATTTYSAFGFDFFDYDDSGNALNSNTWYYSRVTARPGVRNTHGHQPDGVVTPGALNDQHYDIEQAFWAFEGDENGGNLYIGLVVGLFESGGTNSNAGSTYYGAGDLFVGLGQSGIETYAVGTSTDENGEGNRIGVTRADTPWVAQPTDIFGIADPYRADGGTVLSAGQTGYSQVLWMQDQLNNRHNFLAICMTISAAEVELVTGENGGLSFHWTMGCGNDYIDHSDDNPLVPVSEPATVLLLGLGVLGIALRSRRPYC